MPFYLGIYSKNGSIRHQSVERSVTDFKFNDSRRVKMISYPGFHFYYHNTLESSVINTNGKISFLKGWLTQDSAITLDRVKLLRYLNSLMPADSFFSDSEGAFSFIQYNSSEHCLVLATDKFGMVPIFVYEDDEYIIFSNEYEPLTSLKEGDKLNVNSIAAYFVLGTTIDNQTFFRYINKLPAAGILIAKSSDIVNRIYWEPNLEPDNRELAILALETFHLFSLVNRESLDANPESVVLLSAGADSRLILSTLTDEQRTNVLFYTSNLSILSDSEDKDAVGAKLLAQRFHLNHKVERISFYENMFDRNYFLKARNLRQFNVYGGWHGGEFLGGCCINVAPVRGTEDTTRIADDLRHIFSKELLKELTLDISGFLQGFKRSELLFKIRQFSQPFFTSIYSGSKGHWLQPFQLSQQGYSPFWDSRIIQKVLSIPVDFIYSYKFYNAIFKYCDPEFLKIPSNSPLTKRNDSVIPELHTGIEPKVTLPDVHHFAYNRYINKESVWSKKLYNESSMRKILEDKNHPFTKRWLDYEVWANDYMRFN